MTESWLTEPLDARYLEVDGVPTYWVHSDGPTTSGLIFRAGKALESLPQSGIGELIIGLALPETQPSHPVQLRHTQNLLTMEVWGNGNQRELERCLYEMCRSLTNLPFQRLAQASSSLVNAGKNTSRSLHELVLVARFGAIGPGVSAYPSWAARKPSKPVVEAWAAAHFNRQNVVLWVAGPTPPTNPLGLIDADFSKPLPAATTQLVQYAGPTAAIGPSQTNAFSIVATRSHAFSAFVHILRLRLQANFPSGFELIEQEVSAGILHVALMFGPAINPVAVLQILDGLANNPPTEAELSSYQELIASRFFKANGAPALARSAALAAVGVGLGASLELTINELETLDQSDVQTAAASALETLFALLPDVQWLGGERFTLKPFGVAPISGGTSIKPSLQKNETGERSLILAHKGMTQTFEGRTTTVHFDDCVAMLVWGNGNRRLIASDGMELNFFPSLWEHGASLVKMLGQRIPLSRTVPMGEAG